MIEDELVNIWQSSSNQERLKFEKSKLMIELDSSLARFNSWWKNMERVNVISGAVTVLGFLFGVYWAPFISMKIASALIVLWAIYVGTRMSSIKKFKPSDLEENYLDYLKKTRIYLLAQKRVFETSLNWITLSMYPIYILFFVGVWDNPVGRYVAVLSFLALVGVGIYSYYKNKRIVKKEILPRLQKMDELINTMKA